MELMYWLQKRYLALKASILDNRHCLQTLIHVWRPYLARLFIKESLQVKVLSVQDMWSPEELVKRSSCDVAEDEASLSGYIP